MFFPAAPESNFIDRPFRSCVGATVYVLHFDTTEKIAEISHSSNTLASRNVNALTQSTSSQLEADVCRNQFAIQRVVQIKGRIFQLGLLIKSGAYSYLLSVNFRVSPACLLFSVLFLIVLSPLVSNAITYRDYVMRLRTKAI